ncbi:ATP-binding protein [uncultured Enterovirga sp.]|uniref:sensor histidine kinase n=1 Tax=uncultured Enterovirga sp. TaxID=2026352 RepID=UPI0035CA805A
MSTRLDHQRSAISRGRLLEWALVLVSLCLPAILFSLAAWRNHEEVLASSEVRIERTVRILQEHAVKVFETHRLVIEQVNLRARFMDWSSEADRTDLHALMKGLQDSLDQVATITLTDELGRLKASSRLHPVDASIAFADRDWFQAVRDDAPKRPFVSRSYIGRQSGQSVFNIVGRAAAADGAFGGAVAVSVDRSYFDRFYRRVETDPTHSVVLVRQDGTILARDPNTSQVRLSSDGAFFTWLRMGSPDRLVSAHAIRDGVPRIYGFRQVGEYPVYVGYGLTRATALDPWWRNLEVFGLVAALAALALLAVSALAIRQSRRETAALAGLETARADLAAANTTLEEQVAERTAELRDSNEEMQRYAYIVSHDLRAPLVNVMGFTKELATLKPELLAAGILPPEADARAEVERDFDEAIGFISAAIQKMEGLINAILRLSREGRRSFAPERLDMTRLVQGLADAQRHQADVAHATVEVGALPDIVADRVAVEQVFGNLLDNAVKYLDPARPGRVSITGTSLGRHVRYRVEDNGRGIAAADHGRVFDLFRRSGMQDRPGEGIGLAHVRTLVRAMGGRIELESQLGRGTTFTVTLPARFRGEAGELDAA